MRVVRRSTGSVNGLAGHRVRWRRVGLRPPHDALFCMRGCIFGEIGIPYQ